MLLFLFRIPVQHFNQTCEKPPSASEAFIYYGIKKGQRFKILSTPPIDEKNRLSGGFLVSVDRPPYHKLR